VRDLGEAANRSTAPTTCKNCGDTRWVCEAHDERPWNNQPNACRCGEPGMSCPVCNNPRPAGFSAHVDRDKGPVH
jgi:hypothetical protein